MRNTFIALLFLPLFLPAQQPEPVVPVGHAGQITAVDFTSDGRYALSCAEDGEVRLWETSSGRLVKIWDPSGEEIEIRPAFDAVFALKGERILAGSFGNPLKGWDYAKEEPGNEVVFTDPEAFAQPSAFAVAVSANGQEAVTLSTMSELKTWNAKNESLKMNFSKSPEKLTSICYTPDGKTILSGSKKGNIISWTEKTGTPAATVKMHDRDIMALSVSPDGKVLSGSKDNTLKLWDLATGDVIHTFENVYSPGQSSAFSPDGTRIAYGNNYNGIVIWDIGLKKSLDTLSGHRRNITELCFSPDGKRLLSGSLDRSVILWDATSGELLHRLDGSAGIVRQIAISPDKVHACLVREFSNDLLIWDTHNGHILHKLQGHTAGVTTVAFSQLGGVLLSGSDDKTLTKWNILEETITPIVSEPLEEAVQVIAVSPDEKWALTASGGNTALLWDLRQMKTAGTLSGHTGKVTSLSFSPDGKRALTGANDNTVHIYDTETQRRISEIPGQAPRFSPVAFSPTRKYFLSISCDRSVIELWDIDKKTLKKTFSLNYDAEKPEEKIYCGTPTHAIFSPDETQFLMPSGNDVLLWSVDGEKPRYLRGHKDLVKTVAFFPNGKKAVSSGYDGSLKYWDTQTGKLLTSVTYLDDKDWAAITPDGLFDASPGAMEKMYFVQGLTTISLEQMKDLYYEPDLFPILLDYKPGVLRNVGTLGQLDLFPEMDARFRSNKLQIRLKDNGGGIGPVQLFINGTIVLEDACGGKAHCPAIDLESYKQHFYSDPQQQIDNEVSIVAYNAEGTLKSTPFAIYPFAKSSRGDDGEAGDDDLFGDLDLSFGPAPDPALHAIVIGTSNYSGSAIDLDFPDKDAAVMAEVIGNVSRNLFEDRVNIHLMTTDAKEEKNLPSKENIRRVFRQIAASSNAEDILFLFMAGHGTTHNEGTQSDFYYLTMDCGDMNLKDTRTRNNFCIATDTLTAWIREIPAKKRVVVLDACHSGQAAENFFASRSLSSSQKRELERLKDRNGMFVLASSESTQKSWEDKKLQQGLLTYSLLYGLKSRDGIQSDGAVNVLNLFQFSRNYVPELAKGISEDQTPVLTVPSVDASGFSIGWVSDDTEIPLDRKNNFITQSVFLDQERMDDHLYLSKGLDEQLAEDPIAPPLGDMIFVNVYQMFDAYSVRGLYRVKDSKVFLDGRVFYRGEEKAKFKVENVPADQHQQVVKEIVRAVNEVMDNE